MLDNQICGAAEVAPQGPMEPTRPWDKYEAYVHANVRRLVALAVGHEPCAEDLTQLLGYNRRGDKVMKAQAPLWSVAVSITRGPTQGRRLDLGPPPTPEELQKAAEA